MRYALYCQVVWEKSPLPRLVASRGDSGAADQVHEVLVEAGVAADLRVEGGREQRALAHGDHRAGGGAGFDPGEHRDLGPDRLHPGRADEDGPEGLRPQLADVQIVRRALGDTTYTRLQDDPASQQADPRVRPGGRYIDILET